MDTISINGTPEEIQNEENKKGKEKFKLSDKAKAAMATGLAGAAAGIAGKSIIDNITGGTETHDEEPAVTEHNHTHEEAVATPEAEAQVETEVYVNPDEVMLEDPQAGSADTDMIAEVELQNPDDYKPFANNDNIDEVVLQEPNPEEVIIAEVHHEDIVVEDDPTVDIICQETEDDMLIDGMPEISQELLEAQFPHYGEEDIIDTYDPQSDIMA